MKTATGTRENVKVIEEFTSGGLKVEVLEYEKLLGLSNASMAQQIYFMEQQHIHVPVSYTHLRRIRFFFLHLLCHLTHHGL